MLSTIALVLAAWFLLSIVSGVAVGTSIKRLDASPPRRPGGWRENYPFVTGRSTPDSYLTGQKMVEVLDNGRRQWGFQPVEK